MYYYFLKENNIPIKIAKTNSKINTRLNRGYVEFTAEQKEFYEAHPTASIVEVERCELWPVPEDNLETHKMNKISEIEAYDISDNVNGFYLNETLVWLDKETRVGLVNTLNSAEIIGREAVNIWFSGMYITLPISQARQLLAVLEIYATDCYNTTEQHKVNVNALTTIEEVDNYDFTTNYPSKPEFTL